MAHDTDQQHIQYQQLFDQLYQAGHELAHWVERMWQSTAIKGQILPPTDDVPTAIIRHLAHDPLTVEWVEDGLTLPGKIQLFQSVIAEINRQAEAILAARPNLPPDVVERVRWLIYASQTPTSPR